jgi:hypothetical protein
MAIAGKILHGLDAATMSDQQRRKGTPQPCGAANSAAANRSRLVAVETCDLDISRTVLAQMESQLHCIKDKDIPYFARALRADLRDIFIGFGR